MTAKPLYVGIQKIHREGEGRFPGAYRGPSDHERSDWRTSGMTAPPRYVGTPKGSAVGFRGRFPRASVLRNTIAATGDPVRMMPSPLYVGIPVVHREGEVDSRKSIGSLEADLSPTWRPTWIMVVPLYVGARKGPP